jgi:hypothetical protein
MKPEAKGDETRNPGRRPRSEPLPGVTVRPAGASLALPISVMNLVDFCCRRIVPFLAAAALAGPLAAASLLESSPFLPPNTGGGPVANGSAPLELRSILKTGESYEFSLYDTGKKQSTWVTVNEPGHDFLVKAFDPVHDTVTVEQQNRTYQLALKEARIVPLNLVPMGSQSPMQGIAGFPPGASPAGARGQPGATAGPQRGAGPPGAPSMLTPEQIRNLEADINRRRELRRQAAAAAAQQASPPGARR